MFFSVLRAYAYPPAVPCSYLNLRSLPETCDCRAQNYAHGKHKFCYEPSQKHTAKSRFVVCPTRKHTAKLEHTAIVPSMQCANLWHTANSASKHGSWQTVKFVVCQRSTRQIKSYVVCFIRGRRQKFSKKFDSSLLTFSAIYILYIYPVVGPPPRKLAHSSILKANPWPRAPRPNTLFFNDHTRLLYKLLGQ